MWQILADDVDFRTRKELEHAGLLYWRHHNRSPDWAPCPIIPAGTTLQPNSLTSAMLDYAVATLYSGIEYAISVEE